MIVILENEWDGKFSLCLPKMDGNSTEGVKRNFISYASTCNIKQCCWPDVLARRKICRNDNLSTTNPTLLGLDSNTGLHSDRPPGPQTHHQNT
jgi:hypothetical protein